MWTDTVALSGGTALRLASDPRYSLGVASAGSALIR